MIVITWYSEWAHIDRPEAPCPRSQRCTLVPTVKVSLIGGVPKRREHESDLCHPHGNVCWNSSLMWRCQGKLCHPCDLRDVREEHNEEPGLLHILKLWPVEPKHNKAGSIRWVLSKIMEYYLEKSLFLLHKGWWPIILTSYQQSALSIPSLRYSSKQ